MADANEERRTLESQFAHEKEVFERVAKIKAEIEAKRREAESAKQSADFNKAAEIEYGQIPKLF